MKHFTYSCQSRHRSSAILCFDSISSFRADSHLEHGSAYSELAREPQWPREREEWGQTCQIWWNPEVSKSLSSNSPVLYCWPQVAVRYFENTTNCICAAASIRWPYQSWFSFDQNFLWFGQCSSCASLFPDDSCPCHMRANETTKKPILRGTLSHLLFLRQFVRVFCSFGSNFVILLRRHSISCAVMRGLLASLIVLMYTVRLQGDLNSLKPSMCQLYLFLSIDLPFNYE